MNNLLEPRLFRDDPLGQGADLKAMHRLLRAGRRAMQHGAPTYFIHPGDLSWWLYYPPLAANQANRVYVWDDPDQPGECLGFVFVDNNEFTAFLHPDLTEDQRAAMRVWAEEACLGRARETGSKRIFSGFVSERDSTGIRFYDQRGFKYDPGSDYCCFLHHLDNLPPPVLPEDFEISRMGRDELIPARAAAQYGAFQSSAEWEKYLQRYTRFAHSPVYTPELDRIVLSPDGRVSAFCINWLDEEIGIGLFEPVGAHPDFKRQGLSKALLRHALLQLKAAGMQQAIVLTNYDNEPAINLYHSVGFQDNGRLLLFTKAAE